MKNLLKTASCLTEGSFCRLGFESYVGKRVLQSADSLPTFSTAGESRIRLRRIEWKQSEQNCPKIKKETLPKYRNRRLFMMKNDFSDSLETVCQIIENHIESVTKTINKDADPTDSLWWKWNCISNHRKSYLIRVKNNKQRRFRSIGTADWLWWKMICMVHTKKCAWYHDWIAGNIIFSSVIN